MGNTEKIEQVKRYIERTEIPSKIMTRYDMTLSEWEALMCYTDQGFGSLYLAYLFGRARGYRAGKKAAEVTR